MFDRRPRAAPAGKKAGKTEARVHKFTAGYQKRAATLLAEGRAAAGAIAEQRLALDTYALMHAYEGVGLTARVAALHELNRVEAVTPPTPPPSLLLPRSMSLPYTPSVDNS